jgi:hypothetical protein
MAGMRAWPAGSGALPVRRSVLSRVSDSALGQPPWTPPFFPEASTAVTPRRHYAAGRTARQVSLLRRFVPESAFDRSLRKQMRLPA